MPRGGYREGAGGKSKWKHGKTKTIRVPEYLAERVLKIAHDLDEEPAIDDVTSSKTINLSGVTIAELRGKKVVFLEDLLKLGYEIKPSKLADVVKSKL